MSDFNLCHNLMKKPLLKHARAYKNFPYSFRYSNKKKKKKKKKKTLKISNIITSKRPKNIKELEDSLPRNY